MNQLSMNVGTSEAIFDFGRVAQSVILSDGYQFHYTSSTQPLLVNPDVVITILIA